MEVIASAVTALGNAIAAIAGWTGATAIVFIGCITFLIYTERLNIEQIKNFLSKNRR